jgi:hypothetical protein
MNEVPPVTGDWIRGEGERAQKQGVGNRKGKGKGEFKTGL